MSAEPGGSDQVADPELLKQRRRIESIIDARDRVLEQRRSALDLFYSNEIGRQGIETIIRNAVEDYLLESEHAIKNQMPDEDDDEEIPDDPTPDEQIAVYAWSAANLGELHMPEVNKKLQFTGLVDYWYCEDPIVRYTETVEQSPMEGRERKREPVEYQIPMSVSMEAYRVLNRFWNEMGMDIEIDEGATRTEITDEMVEEVEEWRKANL